MHARVKVRRLSQIGSLRFDVVGRTDRDDDFLDVVSVEVSEDHVEGAVGEPLPSFEDGNDGLSRVVADAQVVGRLCGSRC